MPIIQDEDSPINAQDWQECSEYCRDRGDCLKWQYEAATKECYLITQMIIKKQSPNLDSKVGFVTGTRECGNTKNGNKL